MEQSFENHLSTGHFVNALHQLPDSRDNRGKRHSLVFIIVAVILAILVGRSMTSSLHRVNIQQTHQRKNKYTIKFITN